MKIFWSNDPMEMIVLTNFVRAIDFEHGFVCALVTSVWKQIYSFPGGGSF